MKQTEVEKLIQKWAKVPRIEETGPKQGMNAPIMKRIQRRTRLCYALMAAVGLLPLILHWCGVGVPAKLCAVGVGLIVPGGGFIALGSWWGVLIGLIITFLWQKAGFKILDMFGGIVGVIGIWLIGALGGLLAVRSVEWWTVAVAVAAAAVLFGYFEIRVHRLYTAFRSQRAANIENFDQIMAEYDEYTGGKEQTAAKERELDAEGLRAMRYVYDKTVRENGDYRGFDDKLKFPSLAAFRYQFSSLGYVLMLVQTKYTPNFHGYLNRAQQFCIDGFTDPRTCSYWRWESLMGYLRYHRNPIDDSNIMLSGWMLPVITSYGATTHERMFETPDSLKFRVDEKHVYAYDVKGTVEVLHKQWTQHRFPADLIPCEPNIAFPICNSYGLLGLLIYDRDHGTHYAADVLDDIYHNLTTEFCEPSGIIAPRRQYLFGLRFMPDTQLADIPFNDVTIAMEYAPIFPGLAKRCYALMRHNALEIRDGVAYLKGIPWEAMVDMGTQAKNPSMVIAVLEMAAAEHGDTEMLSALKKAETRYLEKSKDPQVLHYRDVSVVSMANLVYAHIAEKGDWYDTILKGPDQSAFTGPILSGCAYPQVLVAKAVSHGEDLDLVLYPGAGPGEQELELARLKAGASYQIAGTQMVFAADADGRARIRVHLEGRTPVHILRAH